MHVQHVRRKIDPDPKNPRYLQTVRGFDYSTVGCLAGYLVEHHYFDTDLIDIRVEQGYEIGRPSLLYLRAERR